MMGSINIAVPTMMTSLRADLSQIQWVLTAFMIARTVVMPTLGWLGGLLGNRRLYLTSLLVYLASCMLCGLSWSFESMLVFRVLQGMSAGYLTPLGMAILHETYPPGKRGTAMGIFMAGMSFGPAFGPTVGGYLVEHLSWRAVFYINLPNVSAHGGVGAADGHPGAVVAPAARDHLSVPVGRAASAGAIWTRG
jgi:MFS transporter, DHA2 family, multidrug resistance protein